MTTANTSLARLGETLAARYSTRVALVSPPRTGSTPVARLLWQHPLVTHHCHEPFEAVYWGSAGVESVERNLVTPMDVATGERGPLPVDGGLLVKEMSFQLDDDRFRFLAELATAPVVFVVRDPRLSTTSRLRVVRELYDAGTFEPWESGWDALGKQVRACRDHGIDYVVLDSDDLRTDPEGVSSALVAALRLPGATGLHRWSARSGLRLVAPEVGALMGTRRAEDDPFYRRVLASEGVQPPEEPDWIEEGELIEAAGLSEHVAEWRALHADLLADPRRLRGEAR